MSDLRPLRYAVEEMSDGQPSIVATAVTQADWDALVAERDALAARTQAAEQALREIEWIWTYEDVGDRESCPACAHYKSKGHASGCTLAAALAGVSDPETP